MSSNKIRKVGASTALLVSGVVAGGVLASSMTAHAATTAPAPSSSSAVATIPRPSDPAVTGAQADKVKAAVVAAHSGTTITAVRKDPDGSYDALGTDAGGNPVFYDVSADLATVTAGGGPGGGRGGHGGGPDAAVTGAEADKVTAAVVAAHSGTTITAVRKDPDGSYDALGTDAGGKPVFYDVSTDLKAVTAHTGGGMPPAPGGSGPTA